MNVLVNLLPDTRQAKQHDHQRRQFFTGTAILVWALCGGLILILVLYSGSQKFLINNNNGKISDKETQIQNIPGILDALNAQEHLSALPNLYSQRTYMTHFLNALAVADPQDLTVNAVGVDASNNLTVTGSGSSFASVAKLERALEAENVTLGTNAQPSNQPYFTNVVVQNTDNGSGVVSFNLSATMSSGVTNGQ